MHFPKCEHIFWNISKQRAQLLLQYTAKGWFSCWNSCQTLRKVTEGVIAKLDIEESSYYESYLCLQKSMKGFHVVLAVSESMGQLIWFFLMSRKFPWCQINIFVRCQIHMILSFTLYIIYLHCQLNLLLHFHWLNLKQNQMSCPNFWIE